MHHFTNSLRTGEKDKYTAQGITTQGLNVNDVNVNKLGNKCKQVGKAQPRSEVR